MRATGLWKTLGIVVGLCALPVVVLCSWHRVGIPPRALAEVHGPQMAPAGDPLTPESATSWHRDDPQEPTDTLVAQRPVRGTAPLVRGAIDRLRPHRFAVPPVTDRPRSNCPLQEPPSLEVVERLSVAPPRSARSVVPTVTPEAESPAVLPAARDRSGSGPVSDAAASWPWPTALVHALDQLEGNAWEAAWGRQVVALLRDLHRSESLHGPDAVRVLNALEELSRSGTLDPSEEAGGAESGDRSRWLRARYALQRRLAIWQAVHRLAAPDATLALSRRLEDASMAVKLGAVEQRLQQLGNADAWREYLLLDSLTRLAMGATAVRADDRSELAREILRRLELADATPQQREFFGHAVWLTFAGELRNWTSEPVNYVNLLQDVEQLELTGSEEAAGHVARHYQTMRWSPLEPVAELGELVNRYYRNANVRVAISEVLLNRLLPHPTMFEEDVNDVLMGGRIFGRSRVSTKLRLVLFPDRDQWRMGLEAHGDVESRTETKRGPAVFHNAGRSRYLARKLLLVDRRGIRTQDAEAEATANNSLTKLRTDLDGVPIVNMMVRSIARQQYDSKAEAARWETEGLVAKSAQTRLDEEVDLQLTQATEKFREHVLVPLHQLGLDPEAVDMETTTDRLIARYRLAGQYQVAAFTPRPQAPADSLFSLQLHESVLNNTSACLQLHGREMALPALLVEIAGKFGRTDYEVPEDVPDDVRIQLADRDPITFSCQDDRIELTLRVARLAAQDRHVWRDFEVRATYAADIDGLHVRLVRDGPIRLRGRRLSLGDQVALRGIFSKVLAQHPDLDLLGNVLLRDPRLHDLRLVQFVIRDGWIGLAVGTGNPVKIRLADAEGVPQRG